MRTVLSDNKRKNYLRTGSKSSSSMDYYRQIGIEKLKASGIFDLQLQQQQKHLWDDKSIKSQFDSITPIGDGDANSDYAHNSHSMKDSSLHSKSISTQPPDVITDYQSIDSISLSDQKMFGKKQFKLCDVTCRSISASLPSSTVTMTGWNVSEVHNTTDSIQTVCVNEELRRKMLTSYEKQLDDIFQSILDEVESILILDSLSSSSNDNQTIINNVEDKKEHISNKTQEADFEQTESSYKIAAQDKRKKFSTKTKLSSKSLQTNKMQKQTSISTWKQDAETKIVRNDSIGKKLQKLFLIVLEIFRFLIVRGALIFFLKFLFITLRLIFNKH